MSGPFEGVANGLPKTAVIGSTGFIGRAFLKAYRRIHPDCVGTARKPEGHNIFLLDLLSPNIAPLRLAETGHKDALIFAANPKIAACEEDKDGTRKVNVTGTLELIRQLAGEGVKPIFASSDYVFDGVTGGYADDAPLNPITEYGRQKAMVEERIGGITGGNHLVIRPGKVFSVVKGDGTLLDEMAGILASGGNIRAAYDQIVNPLFIDDLINAVAALQAHGTRGTVNICSPPALPRYEIALEMARAMGVDASRVIEISIDDLGVGPRRPKNTGMLAARLEREISYVFKPLGWCIERVADNWRKG